MLYHLLQPIDGLGNVFRYITFRSASAAVTALVFCYLAFPSFIEWMKRRRMEQIIRTDGPQAHVENKVGTPTMGGAVFHVGILVTTLLWARVDEPRVWMALVVCFGYALIGLYDDWKKVMERSSDGLAGRWKLLWQTAIGLAVLGGAYEAGWMDATLHIPFYKHPVLDFAELWAGAPDWMGWIYVGIGVFILVGASNAVNLTDGLDGLAIGCTITTAATFAILAYLSGHANFSTYLNIPHVEGAGELAVFALAVIGAGLGFLWFNSYPAQVFMGDVGSLGLGGGLAALAIITKHELLLALVGGIFVLEAVSVMIQVVWFKRTGKRFFLMAPIHHHYEKLGWSEPKIITRFWIISLLLAMVALSTLKLR